MSWTAINERAAMLAYNQFQQGVLKGILEDISFQDVVVRDLSENVLLILQMFYLLGFIPYFIFSLFRLKSYFPNTMAGYKGYVYRNAARYVAVSAKKPPASGELKQGKGLEIAAFSDLVSVSIR